MTPGEVGERIDRCLFLLRDLLWGLHRKGLTRRVELDIRAGLPDGGPRLLHVESAAEAALDTDGAAPLR